jgi:hypothetical protein
MRRCRGVGIRELRAWTQPMAGSSPSRRGADRHRPRDSGSQAEPHPPAASLRPPGRCRPDHARTTASQPLASPTDPRNQHGEWSGRRSAPVISYFDTSAFPQARRRRARVRAGRRAMDRSRSGGVLDPAVSGGEPHSPWPTALDGRRQPKPSRPHRVRSPVRGPRSGQRHRRAADGQGVGTPGRSLVDGGSWPLAIGAY